MKTLLKIVSLVLFVASLFQITIGKKMVVTYLGTDFILPGGCPPPNCNQKLRNCRQDQIE
eukprot:00511.XXX_509_744_1 [CDS] Oithona nana genome sequencing.